MRGQHVSGQTGPVIECHRQNAQERERSPSPGGGLLDVHHREEQRAHDDKRNSHRQKSPRLKLFGGNTLQRINSGDDSRE